MRVLGASSRSGRCAATGTAAAWRCGTRAPSVTMMMIIIIISVTITIIISSSRCTRQSRDGTE